jgi:hypothetical protein
MIAKAYFVSSAYVKQFTILEGNIADDKINVAIDKAQNKYILPALGKSLYDFMVTSIIQNGGPGELPLDYLELLESYITPALVSWTLYESVLTISFRHQNKGIGRALDNFQESSNLDELKYLRGEYRNESEFNQKRLQKFLQANKDKFPEYTEESFDLNASTEAGRFNSGLVFDKKRKRRLIDMYSETYPWSGRVISS